jgi:hypothetical protein
VRLLRPARYGARDLRQSLLAPFLSGNMLRVKFSTRHHEDASFKMPPINHRSLPPGHPAARMDHGEMNLVQLEGIGRHHLPARRSSERGEGKLKATIYLLIFLFAIYSAVKVVPIYVSEYQLSDKMQEQARFAVVNRYSEDQVRENIFKVAQDLEIPVTRESIKVTATNSIVKISIEYTVPVNLFFYHTDLHFAPSSENKALI